MTVDPEDLQETLLAQDPLRFEEFVHEFLAGLDEFTDVMEAPQGPSQGFDMAAVHLPDKEPWFVEARRVAILGTPAIDRVVDASALVGNPNAQFLVVTPGIAPVNVRARAARSRVTVWDKTELAVRTPPELLARYRGHSQPRSARPRPQADTILAKAQSLQSRFGATLPGRPDWVTFQKLVTDSFEFLFVPPLGVPDYESEDSSRRNRRDFVMENSAENGVWAALRTRYNADYIPVDSKNSKTIGKKEVVLAAHYLKPFGLGMLAFVVCRSESSKAADHAVREQWIGNGKLIVILTDKDMIKMIGLKAEGAVAEDHIRTKIADFRKSL
jgi:hypothetical protein